MAFSSEACPAFDAGWIPVQISAAIRLSLPSRKPRQPRRLRSARLKSIPVETSARSVVGARDAAQHLAQIDIPVRLDRGHRQRQKRATGGIADHPQRRERHPGLGGVRSRDMALHVDGGSPGLGAQCGFAVAGDNYLFHAGKTAPDHAPAPQCHAGDHFLVQG
jgi:hypothetical protein